MNISRFFFQRKFYDKFSYRFHRFIYRFIHRKFDIEIPDPQSFESLKSENVTDKKQVTIYISGIHSKIEQFLINGFMIENGIAAPTLSFGPKTLFFRPLSEVMRLIFSHFGDSEFRDCFIQSLYIPVDSPEELVLNKYFIEVFRKINHCEVRFVPIITLWNKNLDQKEKIPNWLNQLTGPYHFWSTPWELVMFLLKRRKLSLRIEVASTSKIEGSIEDFAKRLCKTMDNSKRNVTGASLRNWRDLKNDTLLELDFEGEYHKKLALNTMNAMAAQYTPVYAETISAWLGKLMKTRFSRFDYSQDEILELRKLWSVQDSNIIFVPTHKSYFDYLILNWVLYFEKVTVPLVVAGDNLNFFPLGSILRRMGAFFIRRSFHDDLFYKNLLQNYIGHIIDAGYSVEFFIEGGRSRSGMVRSPRTGMLGMFSEIARSSSRRLYVVPVSITYEKLQEIEDYKKEKTQGKSPESDHFWKKVLALFKVSYGPVYIRFSQPILLTGKFTVETAFKIAETQEKSSVVSFASIFAAVMLGLKELSPGELVERMEECVKIITTLPYIHTAYALNNLDVNCSKLSESLRKQGVLEISQKPDGRETILRLTHKSKPVMQFYKNSAAFTFAPFFCELFRDTEFFGFVTEFLESTIMGYYSSLNSEYSIDRSAFPDWFVALLREFFADNLKLFRAVLKNLASSELLPRKHRADLVKSLNSLVVSDFPLVTDEEIYEIIFFLEKKEIITGELSELNAELAEKYSGTVDALFNFLQKIS
ncbi:1-acyl-sn-glycerol-3-phosphate acyltransferase [bacterium]|nr:1-acyl-sn-glycerol-3-phosphate acyltransferase [bacterium]